MLTVPNSLITFRERRTGPSGRDLIDHATTSDSSARQRVSVDGGRDDQLVTRGEDRIYPMGRDGERAHRREHRGVVAGLPLRA
jgi:hypothetical protein